MAKSARGGKRGERNEHLRFCRRRVDLSAGGYAVACATTAVAERWSAERANQWYARQPWLVGANYIPSDAINELEMFQATTFNAAPNDKELGMAESIGMNTIRVFLQDQLWKQDTEGFKGRLDTFLSIAAGHHIRPILVLFDSFWETDPKLGPQHPPIPGIHNSSWVQSPGKRRLLDKGVEPVKGRAKPGPCGGVNVWSAALLQAKNDTGKLVCANVFGLCWSVVCSGAMMECAAPRTA